MEQKQPMSLEAIFAKTEQNASAIERIIENLTTVLIPNRRLNGLKEFTGGKSIVGESISVDPILQSQFNASIRNQNPKGKRIQILNDEDKPEITISLLHRQLARNGIMQNYLDVSVFIKDDAWNGGYNPQSVATIAQTIRSALEEATDKEIDLTIFEKQIKEAHKQSLNYSIERCATFNIPRNLPNTLERKKSETLLATKQAGRALTHVLWSILS